MEHIKEVTMAESGAAKSAECPDEEAFAVKDEGTGACREVTFTLIKPEIGEEIAENIVKGIIDTFRGIVGGFLRAVDQNKEGKITFIINFK